MSDYYWDGNSVPTKVLLQFRKQFGTLVRPPHAQEIKTLTTMKGLMDKE